ncbi:unnamed protein product [Clonostachys byssicola]|uniref:ribonuclease H n=1 Tax=Clonostachys byssicola TaxID=160290 RepID=A0A9N9UID8_9HYPO|nr:unnamed protein product [Clonostachys byssicola]
MDSYSTHSNSRRPRGPTAPSRCAVCFKESRLHPCGGCKVVHYCSAEHSLAHRSSHKVSCITIKKTRERLEHEKSKLRARTDSSFEAQSSSEDIFQTGLGKFWGIVETRNYMRARFAAASALLQVDTKDAVESALEHFNEMIRLGRSDDQGVRDIIPHLLLRLGREQECYHFLKWWATAENPRDVATPYLYLPEADPLESVEVFSSNETSVGHLVALTLLKMRLFLDMDACSTFVTDLDPPFDPFDPYANKDRPQPGHCVRNKIREMNMSYLKQTTRMLRDQFLTLYNQAHDANPYIWRALVDGKIPSPPRFYRRGSKEEADWIIYQCHHAWIESGEAMMLIDAHTVASTTMNQDEAAAASGRDTSSASSRNRPFQIWSKARGTGKAFPSKFQSIYSPSNLFRPTVKACSDIARFVHHKDPTKVLVFVGGACSNNGQQEPRAGWAVVFGPPTYKGKNNDSYFVSGRLEDKGPFGDSYTGTTKRAELRAAIAALRLCDWQAEGYANLVIATDSTYVVGGATEWTKIWAQYKWTTCSGGHVKHRDLWQLVLGEVERWANKGVFVEFWKIQTGQNEEADRAANRMVQTASAVGEFEDVPLNSGQSRTSRQLPDSCSQKGTLVENMEKPATRYSEGTRSAEATEAVVWVGGFTL